jgi:hypothetical protein
LALLLLSGLYGRQGTWLALRKKLPREPVDVLYMVVYWINYWCDLQVQNWSCNGAQDCWEELRMRSSKREEAGSHGIRGWGFEEES